MNENDIKANTERALKRFVEHMLQHTSRLVCLDENNQPITVASGFLVKVGENYRVISAGHAIGNMMCAITIIAGDVFTICAGC